MTYAKSRIDEIDEPVTVIGTIVQEQDAPSDRYTVT